MAQQQCACGVCCVCEWVEECTRGRVGGFSGFSCHKNAPLGPEHRAGDDAQLTNLGPCDAGRARSPGQTARRARQGAAARGSTPRTLPAAANGENRTAPTRFQPRSSLLVSRSSSTLPTTIALAHEVGLLLGAQRGEGGRAGGRGRGRGGVLQTRTPMPVAPPPIAPTPRRSTAATSQLAPHQPRPDRASRTTPWSHVPGPAPQARGAAAR